ncbi:hypothetical protein [Mesobacillus foraminis]|uniref:hypothetical protein n=1 Tax=Mesobacillus foraminis TaxID=279826 RepID=UPI001048AB2B|nr:hypothetical protein [Mesobacillus foraminis]
MKFEQLKENAMFLTQPDLSTILIRFFGLGGRRKWLGNGLFSVSALFLTECILKHLGLGSD